LLCPCLAWPRQAVAPDYHSPLYYPLYASDTPSKDALLLHNTSQPEILYTLDLTICMPILAIPPPPLKIELMLPFTTAA
jgi:hypothetical protein